MREKTVTDRKIGGGKSRVERVCMYFTEREIGRQGRKEI